MFTIFKIKQILIAKQPTLTPNLSIIRKVLFWDTNFEQIDWQKQKTAVIKRIFERGNDQEMNEVIRFYGKETVQTVLSLSNHSKPFGNTRAQNSPALFPAQVPVNL